MQTIWCKPKEVKRVCNLLGVGKPREKRERLEQCNIVIFTLPSGQTVCLRRKVRNGKLLG